MLINKQQSNILHMGNQEIKILWMMVRAVINCRPTKTRCCTYRNSAPLRGRGWSPNVKRQALSLAAPLRMSVKIYCFSHSRQAAAICSVRLKSMQTPHLHWENVPSAFRFRSDSPSVIIFPLLIVIGIVLYFPMDSQQTSPVPFGRINMVWVCIVAVPTQVPASSGVGVA